MIYLYGDKNKWKYIVKIKKNYLDWWMKIVVTFTFQDLYLSSVQWFSHHFHIYENYRISIFNSRSTLTVFSRQLINNKKVALNKFYVINWIALGFNTRTNTSKFWIAWEKLFGIKSLIGVNVLRFIGVFSAFSII